MKLPGLTLGAATSDRVNCGSDASLDNLDPFTMLVWAYATTLTIDRDIMSKGGGTTKEFKVTGGSSANMELKVSRATTAAQYISNSAPLVLNRWLFLACTFDSSQAATAHLYAGSAEGPAAEAAYGTSTAGTGAVNDDSAQNLWLGNNSGNVRSWQGTLGPAAYLAQALSLAEIRQWQRWTLDPSWRPGRRWQTRLYLRPGQQGSGTQLDLSGYGNHGTVTGAAAAPGPAARPRARRGVGGAAAAAAPDMPYDLPHSPQHQAVMAM